jgi:predicted glycoside hydrolase/deacetylase ChbG (UPF0249 family)
MWMTAKVLIINADDFGFSTDINSAIEKLYLEKRVTNATLMVYGKAVHDALSIIHRNPHLSVGLHLDLCEVLGFYQVSYAQMRENLRTDPEMLRKVADEVDRQIQCFKALGLEFTHMDGHRHFHALPEVFPLVVEVAVEHGLKSIRLTKQWLLPRTPSVFWDDGYLVHATALLRRYGIVYPDHFVFGWKDYPIANFQTGLNELMVHIGFDDENYLREYKYLSSHEFTEMMRENKIELRSYHEVIT